MLGSGDGVDSVDGATVTLREAVFCDCGGAEDEAVMSVRR